MPFTGESGRLLDELLAAYGISRDTEAYVDNAAACHPPYVDGQKSTAPPTAVVEACRPRLEAELRSRPIESMVLLGRTAGQALLKDDRGINQLRVGPPKSSAEWPGIKIIPTIHPAAALRQPDNFPHISNDLEKLVHPVGGDFVEPETRVLATHDGAMALLEAIMEDGSPFVLDIETDSDKDAVFTHPDRLLCVGIATGPNYGYVITEEVLEDNLVQATLCTAIAENGVICQNGKFDLQVLMRRWPGLTTDWLMLNPLRFDTMLASYALDERPGVHGLKYLGAEIFGAPDWDAAARAYTSKGEGYDNIPTDLLLEYNGWDVVMTWRVMEYLAERLERENLNDVHTMLCQFSNTLMAAELDGISFDLVENQRLWDDYTERLDGLEEPLKRWVMNPRSPKQVGEALDAMGIYVSDTQADTLQKRLDVLGPRDTGYDFLCFMLEYRKVHKFFSTYIKGLRKRVMRTDKLYSTFKLHGTVTGRLASSNPNLQNIPRGDIIKNQFVPAEGNTFVQADYSQVELRVMAIEGNDEYMLGVLGDHTRDIHGEVATRFFGDGWSKDQRVRAKAVVFGLAYGRTAYSLAEEYGWTENEAERYVKEFFELIPGIQAWRENIIRSIKGGNPLETPFGRRRRFWLITQKTWPDIKKEALSTIPQSTASDITLHAATRLRPYLSQEGAGLRIPVHDSLLVECPIERKERVMELMGALMPKVADDVYAHGRLPFPVDVEAGDSWGALS